MGGHIMEGEDRVKHLLQRIYGESTGKLALQRIMALIEGFSSRRRKKEEYFSQEDVVLITYGDSLLRKGETPLATLHSFANKYLEGAVSNIHFLPFCSLL